LTNETYSFLTALLFRVVITLPECVWMGDFFLINMSYIFCDNLLLDTVEYIRLEENAIFNKYSKSSVIYKALYDSIPVSHYIRFPMSFEGNFVDPFVQTLGSLDRFDQLLQSYYEKQRNGVVEPFSLYRQFYVELHRYKLMYPSLRYKHLDLYIICILVIIVIMLILAIFFLVVKVYYKKNTKKK